MMFLLLVAVLMTVRCFSAGASECKESLYVGATNCGNGDPPDVIDTSPVTSHAECAKMCTENPHCKSLAIQRSDDETVCSLLQERWPSGNCAPSTSYYNKIGCENGGMLVDWSCRCVGGYVGVTCENIMKDCSDGFESGAYRTSGVYKVWPPSAPSPFLVYCYMSTKSGKTYIQRQTVGGGVNFNRSWNEYDVGFGNVSGDHWLGNTYIHYLTQKQPLPALTLNVMAGGNWRMRYYFRFNLTDKTNLFRFTYGWSETEAEVDYSLGDCFPSPFEYGFSTPDNDNDGSPSHCAERRGSGWWFNKCLKCDLNAKVTGLQYSEESDVNWYPGLDQSLAITATAITV